MRVTKNGIIILPSHVGSASSKPDAKKKSKVIGTLAEVKKRKLMFDGRKYVPPMVVGLPLADFPEEASIKRSRRAVKRLYGRLCSYCSQPAFTVDHVMPKKHGGTNSVNNLVPCCIQCNRAKGSKSVLLFLAKRLL